MNTASGVQALAQFPWAQAGAINDQYFAALSNGGLGNLPSPVTDDSITTDQVVGRRMQKPPIEEASKLRFSPDLQGNLYYQADARRMQTAGEQISRLALRGVGVIGTDNFGQYNRMILNPPSTMLYAASPSGKSSVESSTDSIGVILWVLIGVGVIALLGRATSIPVTL